MGSSLKYLVTYNMDFINQVLKDDEMWPRVSCDGQDKETFYKMPDGKEVFVIPVKDGISTGFYHLHPVTDAAWQIHANILKPHRKFAYELSEGIIKWIQESMPAINTLVAYIPECFPDVIRHTSKMGFETTGYIPAATRKNGELVNVHILTRGV